MLMEMVSLSLTVFFSFQTITQTSSIIQANISQSIESPIPKDEQLGRNSGTQTPSQINPTQIPTATPTITPSPTMLPTVTPTSIPTNTPTLTPAQMPTAPTITTASDLEALFSTYSDMYHVDKELLKRIAQCESGFNMNAEYGDYLGMFQYAVQSWTTIRSEMGTDTNTDLRKNAEETIKTAAFQISHHGTGAWPNCSN